MPLLTMALYFISLIEIRLFIFLIPTNLIGMADASTAGKTGLNSGKLKNLIGTIYLPEKVYINTNFLKTCSTILDAGTGVGNSAKLFSSNPNSQVFAIDASESIEFAYKKYGKIKNIHFLQADIRKLPFKKSFFDFICSDQVLHHTKDTETSFKYLTKFFEIQSIPFIQL